jgi:hypothetical protein
MSFTEMVPLIRECLPRSTTAESTRNEENKSNETNKPTGEVGVFVLEGDISTIE